MTKVFLLLLLLMIAELADAQQNVTTLNQSTMPVVQTNKTGDVGLGATLGTPTTFNVKFWTTEETAVNVNVTGGGGDLGIMADHLWHFRRAYSNDPEVDRPAIIAPYLGAGLVLIFDTTADSRQERPLYRRTNNEQGTGIGARLPVGLEFLPETTRFGVFGEIAPGAIFSPSFFSFFQAGLGGRYYF